MSKKRHRPTQRKRTSATESVAPAETTGGAKTSPRPGAAQGGRRRGWAGLDGCQGRRGLRCARRRCEPFGGLVERGLDAALERPPRPPRCPKLTPAVERDLLAVAQSPPPVGRVRWTLHRLADRLVQLDVGDSLSDETVRRGLKKTTSRRTARLAG